MQDRGPGFNPEKLEPAGPLDQPGRLSYEGGFGIPLMRVLADEIKINSADEGTTVQLVVYTPLATDSPSSPSP